MNWKVFFIKFFRNIVIGVLFGVIFLGGFGYLLAGSEGLVNMTYWGLALGLIGSFSSGLGMIFQAKFWSEEDNYKMFPDWIWFIKKSDNEED